MLTFLPLALLVVLLTAVVFRVGMLRSAHGRAVPARQERSLERTGAPRVGIHRRGEEEGILIGEQFVPLGRQGDELLIYVFGGSSVVLPSLDAAFPGQLERRLRAFGHVRVVNLGEVGANSFELRERALAAMAFEPPDLLIFYGGHNDYGYSYGKWLHGEWGFFAGSALLGGAADVAIGIPLLAREPHREWSSIRTEARFRRTTFVDPPASRHLQHLGLLRPDPAVIQSVDQNLVNAFLRSVKGILGAAANRSVPVLLITPISNLHVEPFGIGPQAHETYHRGLAAEDREERLRLLDAARDLDVFNTTVRAKSRLSQALVGLRRPGVHVLELQQELEEEVDFSFDDFEDFVHLRPQLHARVAERVARQPVVTGLFADGDAPVVGRIDGAR